MGQETPVLVLSGALDQHSFCGAPTRVQYRMQGPRQRAHKVGVQQSRECYQEIPVRGRTCRM